MNALAVVCSSIIFVAGIPVDGQEPPKARDLERKMLEYRQGLGRGHVVITSKYKIYKNSREYEKITRTYDVLFDRSKARSFIMWKHPNWERETKAVLTDTDFIADWSPDFPIKFGKDNRREDPLASTPDAFHPQLLGLRHVPATRLHRYRIGESFWYSKGDDKALVSPDQVAGEDAWRIEYRPSPANRVILWVVPRFGYSPARIEVRSETANGFKSGQSLDSEYTLYPVGNVWYPRRTVYRSWFGDTVDLEEVAEIERAEFGIKIDPKTFGFEGLDLPPGRKVMGPSNRAMIWDGQRLIRESYTDLAREAHNDPPVKRRWLWWAGAGLSSMTATALVVRRIRGDAGGVT